MINYFNAEMNQKIVQAGQALQDDYDYFEKHLSLFQPFSTRPVCAGGGHFEEETPYWFHPDHLGSSSYISNEDGYISQHMEYFPYGETLVEEHKNSNNSPYKFNAKELDDETGNYYYGARYLNPKWSFWLSVDPLAEKYPGWSPYNYTLLNPLKFIDPDGRSVAEKGCPDPPCNHDYLGMDRDYVNVLIDDIGRINNSRNNENISESENKIFKAPYGIDGPDGTKLWSKYGSQNIGLHKGKSSVSVDVEELQGLGGNPTGAEVQSTTNKILGLIIAILNPIANQVGNNNETTVKENKSVFNENNIIYVNDNVEFLVGKIGSNGPFFHRQVTSNIRTPYYSKKKADSANNARKQDSIKNMIKYKKMLYEYENKK